MVSPSLASAEPSSVSAVRRGTKDGQSRSFISGLGCKKNKHGMRLLDWGSLLCNIERTKNSLAEPIHLIFEVLKPELTMDQAGNTVATYLDALLPVRIGQSHQLAQSNAGCWRPRWKVLDTLWSFPELSKHSSKADGRDNHHVAHPEVPVGILCVEALLPLCHCRVGLDVEQAQGLCQHWLISGPVGVALATLCNGNQTFGSAQNNPLIVQLASQKEPDEGVDERGLSYAGCATDYTPFSFIHLPFPKKLQELQVAFSLNDDRTLPRQEFCIDAHAAVCQIGESSFFALLLTAHRSPL